MLNTQGSGHLAGGPFCEGARCGGIVRSGGRLEQRQVAAANH